MEKSNFILFHLLFIVCFACVANNKSSVADIYSSQIGVRELTGHNDGKQVEEFLHSCNLSKGNPWCAAFITWTFKKAEVKAVVSGYAPNWFPRQSVIYTRGQMHNKIPNQADVFGIWFPSKKRIAHVGFIDEWLDGSFAITVEGNTNEAGSREGDGVYRKRRLKSQIYKVSRWL